MENNQKPDSLAKDENVETSKVNTVPTNQEPPKKKKFNLEDVEDEKVIIVPNPEKKGNFAYCKKIELGTVGTDTEYPAFKFYFVEKDTQATLDYACIIPEDLDDDSDDADIKNYRNSWNRIKQMFNSFHPDGEIPKGAVSGDTNEEIYNAFMAVIDPNYPDVLAKLKVVYNHKKKNLVTLATVGNVISTKYKKRDFTWNDEYDKVLPAPKSGGSSSSGGFSPAGGGDDDMDL